jgi:3-oxoacyl-[acyl-carrier protein] reductase
MLLQNKVAVVYGAGGRVGGAVARSFGREGAKVFLAGRSQAPLEAVAQEIAAAGGQAEAAAVDALEERAVDAHVDSVAERAGAIDVSFDAIGFEALHGTPLVEMSYEDFARPVETALRAQFLTARAAARHMVRRGSGVIMAITATTARHAIPEVGGTGVAFDAIESQCRQWAAELGPHGVRVVWLQTTGLPEAISTTLERFPAYGTGAPEGMTRDELIEWLRRRTMLNKLTSLEEVGAAAAFMASDRASAMTATGANLTGGAVPG